MCLTRCNVRINGIPSGLGIWRGRGHNYGGNRHRLRQRRARPAEGGIHTDTGGIDAGSTVLPTNSRGAEGLRTPAADHRPTTANYGHPNEAVPATAVRSYRARTTNSDPEEWTGRSLEETSGPRNRRGSATGTGRHDLGRTAIWIGTPRFEDAVSECVDVSSPNGPRFLPMLRKTEARNFPTLRTCEGQIKLSWQAVSLNSGLSYDPSPPAVPTNSGRCCKDSTP